MSTHLPMKPNPPIMIYKYYSLRHPWAQDTIAGIFLVFGEGIILFLRFQRWEVFDQYLCYISLQKRWQNKSMSITHVM